MYDVCMCVWHISGEVAQKRSRQMAIFFRPAPVTGAPVTVGKHRRQRRKWLRGGPHSISY